MDAPWRIRKSRGIGSLSEGIATGRESRGERAECVVYNEEVEERAGECASGAAVRVAIIVCVQ